MVSTVVVIGAGASKEFGRDMPTGAELATSIQDLLDRELRRGSSATPIREALARDGGLRDEHLAAMRRIRDGLGGKDSIDDFIAEWQHLPTLSEVAKLCISHCILQSESGTELIGEEQGGRLTGMANVRGTWLGQIARYANPSVARRDVSGSLSNVGFVTFNYDRCIERFLTGWFQMQGLEESDLVNLRRQVPVYHIYGSLGHTSEWGGTVAFGASDVWSTLRAAKNIKTYTEALTPTERKQIYEMVSGAENVLLLGVGYHPQNLAVLFGNSGFNGLQKVWATTLNLRRRQLERAQGYFGAAPAENVRFLSSTASDLLNEYRDDIFDP